MLVVTFYLEDQTNSSRNLSIELKPRSIYKIGNIIIIVYFALVVQRIHTYNIFEAQSVMSGQHYE